MKRRLLKYLHIHRHHHVHIAIAIQAIRCGAVAFHKGVGVGETDCTGGACFGFADLEGRIAYSYSMVILNFSQNLLHRLRFNDTK